jgi:hypothetical protein
LAGFFRAVRIEWVNVNGAIKREVCAELPGTRLGELTGSLAVCLDGNRVRDKREIIESDLRLYVVSARVLMDIREVDEEGCWAIQVSAPELNKSAFFMIDRTDTAREVARRLGLADPAEWIVRILVGNFDPQVDPGRELHRAMKEFAERVTVAARPVIEFRRPLRFRG